LSIPIGKGRRYRRSYANYKPPSRKTGPGNDPFRIILYLLGIAGCIWVIRNPMIARQQAERFWAEQVPQGTPAPDAASTSPTAQVSLSQLGTQADEAYREGHLDEAIKLYQQAADAEPNNVDYHLQVARLLLFQSALEYGSRRDDTLKAALEAADKTILANPERPEGYAIEGKILDWNGQTDQAATQILRALEADKNYAVGHAYLAEVLVDQTRWDQAQQSIDTALALDPNNVDIRRDYGYVLETLGDYAGAATQYETVLQLQPNLSYVKMALGRDYRVIGRAQEALDLFFSVSTLEPNNALIHYEIGRTYETYIGDPTSALQAYDQAIQIDENYASPWMRTGTLYYVQGSYAQAIPAFEHALALGTQTVDLYYQLGLSYANEGQCKEAVPNLQKAQEMAEGDERILDAVQAGYEMCQQTPLAPATDAPNG
jgi:tetratricopeptide (TPR) repeat protein